MPDLKCDWLYVDDLRMGPVQRQEEDCGPGMFVLSLGLCTREMEYILGEAECRSSDGLQRTRIESLAIFKRLGLTFMLCADLGPAESPVEDAENYLLLNGKMITDLHGLALSGLDPMSQPLARFRVLANPWRKLRLAREGCDHCADAHGPCTAEQIERRAMRPVIGNGSNEKSWIEIVQLRERRRLLIEPIAGSSESFLQVRALVRIQAVFHLDGRTRVD